MSERPLQPHPQLPTSAPDAPGAPGWQGVNWGANAPSAFTTRPVAPGDEGNAFTRFIGGSPLAVFFRLLILSLVAGALLVWLDIHPRDIFFAFERFIRRVWYMGFDALREIATYILAGAVIVVPLWLLIRLFSAGRR